MPPMVDLSEWGSVQLGKNGERVCMCSMKELVVVVANDRLDPPWVACRGDDGTKVVFVREDSQHLLGTFCAMGVRACPIFAALSEAA